MGIKSRIQQALGRDAPYVNVLPVPVLAARAPQTTDIIPEGALFIDTSVTPNVIYTSLGNGTFATGGTGLSVTGTANQITANTVSTVATLSIPTTFIAPGSIASTTSLTATLGNITATNGNLTLGTAGNKINVTTGANASAGTTGALTAGAIVVSTTAVTANSLVFFTTNALGTVTVPQSYRVSARTPGTSFTIQSQDATDTSTVNWWLIN